MGLHQRQIGLKSVDQIGWTGKKVLDIGCSNGKLSLEIFAKLNIQELIGVDPAPDRILKANNLGLE